MLRDWNFWCTVMTSVAAVVAIGVSVHQIRLSNKQQLFERRLKAYMMANSIISLCKENYVFLSEKRKAEPQFANDLVFVWLTNNTYMEGQAEAIEHPLEQPFHKELLKKREELRNMAMEFELIFKGNVALLYIYIDKELQRISRESLAQTGEKGIMFKFPTIRGCNSTVLVLKEPKTKTSVRKVFLPKAVAEMLVERKKMVDELKELLGDEYRDYNLVFASTQGTPTESNFIDRAFTKLIADNHLPKVVFHSLRHTSTTYKLKLSGGDIKAVQGDTGHAQATMVTERYAHILDDDRRVNATRFQKEFYGGGEPETAAGEASEVQRASTDLLQSLDAATKQQLLLKLLAESPDMATLLTALTGKGA